MNTVGRATWAVPCALLLLLSSCAGAGGRQNSDPAAAPTGSMPSSSGSAAADVTVTRDVAYESSSINELGLLDVYAPSGAGEWPVVVMYHGGTWGVYKSYLARYANRVAALGYVVFVPSWGHGGGAAYDALTVKEQIAADATQAACAAAFAAEHAEEYGGDADSFTVFGHSFGANAGSILILAPPAVADGCLANDVPEVDTFVAWEGAWLLLDTFVDPWLVDDPTILDAITPWSHLPAPADLRFVFLRSENPGEGRSTANATGQDGWLALRDADGTLTAALQASGAFEEDIIGPAALDTILIDALRAQGADVRLEIMPDSSHQGLGVAGWDVFLEAFREIAGG